MQASQFSNTKNWVYTFSEILGWPIFCFIEKALSKSFFSCPVLSHHYPSMVGALLCVTVLSIFLSWPDTFIAVTPLLVKFDSWWSFLGCSVGCSVGFLYSYVLEYMTCVCVHLSKRMPVIGPIYLGYIPFTEGESVRLAVLPLNGVVDHFCKVFLA